MARPASGSVRWNATANAWEVRVTLANGQRSKPIAMTGLPLCDVAPRRRTGRPAAGLCVRVGREPHASRAAGGIGAELAATKGGGR